MFASPIFYPVSFVPEKWRLVLAVNPLTGIIEGLRSSLLGLPFNWPLIGISFGISIVVSILALTVFTRMEDSFADII